MTSRQYEELCRAFVAELFHIGVDRVLSIDVITPARHGLAEYAHQIDLHWEIETDASRYLHIANAKWHKQGEPVKLADVLLLQQVKTKVAAHKALLLTNTGFTEGALAAARDERIGLHLVCPTFDAGRLHSSDPEIIRSQLQSLSRLCPSRQLYGHGLIQKSFSGGEAPARGFEDSAPATGQAAGGRPVVFPPPPASTGSIPAAPAEGGGRSFTYQTKRGPGPGFRTK